MFRSKGIPVLIALLIAATSIEVNGEQHCWDFDTIASNWVDLGPFAWKYTADFMYPDTSSIPSFYNLTGYMWFQDQATPPTTGSAQSPSAQPVTLNSGDYITAVIFRHILVGQENDTARPEIKFQTGGVTVNIEFSWEYDKWSEATHTCNAAGSKGACCPSYPCTGYFVIDGMVNIRDELIAVNSLGVNGGCTGITTATTPAPTTTPTPDPTWCCNFDTIDLCGWSPTYISDGWIWSEVTVACNIPIAVDFVYVIDTTATLTSPLLINVPHNAYFTVTYYFQTNNPGNTLTASFNGISLGTLPTTGGTFITRTLSTLADLCAGTGNTCNGYFKLDTYVLPLTVSYAGLDYFSVEGYDVCPYP